MIYFLHNLWHELILYRRDVAFVNLCLDKQYHERNMLDRFHLWDIHQAEVDLDCQDEYLNEFLAHNNNNCFFSGYFVHGNPSNFTSAVAASPQTLSLLEINLYFVLPHFPHLPVSVRFLLYVIIIVNPVVGVAAFIEHNINSYCKLYGYN